jgi:circadian clock protein KaiC
LLIGPSGSGKTSFGINFLAQSTEAEPGLHFGFYETPDRLLLKAKALGLDLKAKTEAGQVEILWQPLTENLLDKLAYRLLDAVTARGVKRLFLDSLGGFERAAIQRARLVEFFAALTNELRALGVTTIGTWELRDLFASEVAAPGPEISSLLDNLIMMRQVEIRSEYKRVLSVLKIRDQSYEAAPQEVIIDGHGLAIKGPFELATGISTGLARPLEV